MTSSHVEACGISTTSKNPGESPPTARGGEREKLNNSNSDGGLKLITPGDRVKYIGPSVQVEADNRIILGKITTSDGPTNAYTIIRGRALSTGQRGEVYEVNGDSVAVIMDICESKEKDGEKDDKLGEKDVKPSVYWLPGSCSACKMGVGVPSIGCQHDTYALAKIVYLACVTNGMTYCCKLTSLPCTAVKEIEHDPDAQAEDFYIAMGALCEVLLSMQPLIVYFPDCSQWFSRAVPKSDQKEFVYKVQEIFDQLSGPVVLICGQNKVETGSKEKEKFTMILPNFGRLAKLPLSLKRLTEGLKATKRSQHNGIYRLFNNVLCIQPPKEEELLRTFNRQVEEDRRIVISRSNISELHMVLEDNNLSCLDLLNVNTDGVILTKQKAEKVVGWARNHYLSSCLLPSIKGERLNVPRESLEIAIVRLKEQEQISRKPLQSLKACALILKLQNLAKDEYESNFVSAVVPPGEIGVKFDDIGALEDVKKALNELAILPMRRPELFCHGNLLRPCKGILLFGPPGTGKTLLAKALATEAGANFISITGSTLTSKWFGDAEKLTKALFSFASKLSPVIIFVDEVDSLLGARGGAFEHEATRRMRNEFMAAWDGLRSKESQRILILGATNRPFDLDDAVIRRLPRRIYVDLPDAENRMKILKIFLAQEKLSSDFEFDKLANATEGYSGSDLKNLCIAAAYRPVQELLDEEKKGGSYHTSLVLRPLNLNDFIQSKAKVGPSVSYDAATMNELRKWNEQYGEGGSRRRSPFGFGN
ncbi:ATPase, AAA-type, core [Dillenia turbinata]|uniref:ATPase, AAA-type, core n=1 Tax=Dillenia turbinata TaxID=194707 RepID=A0AAN8USR0_9MAGN